MCLASSKYTQDFTLNSFTIMYKKWRQTWSKSLEDLYISRDTMWELCSSLMLLWTVSDLETGECEMSIISSWPGPWPRPPNRDKKSPHLHPRSLFVLGLKIKTHLARPPSLYIKIFSLLRGRGQCPGSARTQLGDLDLTNIWPKTLPTFALVPDLYRTCSQKASDPKKCIC